MTAPERSDLNIIFLDNHLIAVNKPAGLPTQSDRSRAPSLLETTRAWLKKNFDKPGNVYLGLVHRLDRNVSGVVLFARTSRAASRLARQFRERSVKKVYRVLVDGRPKQANGELVHYLRKEKSLKATVFPRPAPDAKRAELSYSLIESNEKTSLLEINLKTGRFHQIRAQLSFSGHPILGDRKYGSQSESPLLEGIALYASTLVVQHPISGESIAIKSPPPSGWPEAGS